MMQLLWRCRKCGMMNFVDFGRLESWQVDSITTAHGFTCTGCEHRQAVSYTNSSLEQAFRKLNGYAEHNDRFKYQFLKTLKKATQINERYAEKQWREPKQEPG